MGKKYRVDGCDVFGYRVYYWSFNGWREVKNAHYEHEGDAKSHRDRLRDGKIDGESDG